MSEIIDRVQKWIQWCKEKGEYHANLLEDDYYNVVIRQLIESLRSRIEQVYTISIELNDSELRKEAIEAMDLLERWERVLDKIWLEFYELCAKKELDEAEEYSILDGYYEISNIESNFIRWAFRLMSIDPEFSIKLLTSPAIEYRAKILFLPILYTARKLGIKIDCKYFENNIHKPVIEEEIHKVLTMNLGDEVSKKFDNVSKKVVEVLCSE